jgi:hypothetical protein
MTALSNKPGEIVGTMNTALSNNQAAISEAFEANRKAVQASERQSKAAVHVDQRAWIGIEKLIPHPPVFQIGQIGDIDVVFKNTGKTPARNVVAYTFAERVPRGKRPDFSSYEGELAIRQGLLSPVCP